MLVLVQVLTGRHLLVYTSKAKFLMHLHVISYDLTLLSDFSNPPVPHLIHLF